MDFDAAEALARYGVAVTRDKWRGRFWIIRSGKSLTGAYIGETGLARVQAGEPSPDDRRATDWRRFVRVAPDDWEGCDAGDGKQVRQ